MICYVEAPGQTFEATQQWERPRCRVMACASTFYTPATDAMDRWWSDYPQRILDWWDSQNWDHPSIRFDWFADPRLNPVAQLGFSNYLAANLRDHLRRRNKRIDFIYYDNEHQDENGRGLYSAAYLKAQLGDLNELCDADGNWNYAKGKSGTWWNGRFSRPPGRFPIYQTYHVRDDATLASMGECMRINGTNGILWGPCGEFPDQPTENGWGFKSKDLAMKHLERLVVYAVTRGHARMGLAIYKLPEEWKHDTLDMINNTIIQTEKLVGRSLVELQNVR